MFHDFFFLFILFLIIKILFIDIKKYLIKSPLYLNYYNDKKYKNIKIILKYE